jgi:Tfp pilus assembly protein PilF
MTIASNSREPSVRSPAVVRLLQEATRALAMDRPAAAEEPLDRALKLVPDDAEAHRLMGIATLMTGKHAQAVEHLRSAIALQPDDATIHMTLGSALFETGAIEDGLVHLRRACELALGQAQAWYNLGTALQFASSQFKEVRYVREARHALEHAVTIDPGYITARNKLAATMLSLGDTQDAVATLRETLNRQPDCVDAWLILHNVKAARLSSDDIRQLRKLLHQPGMGDDARIALTFALAKALEDQADYPAAFDAVSEANALQRKHVHWSREEERARVDAIAQAFGPTLSTAPDPTLGSDVIFVTCMPRSASTLTEQILASHPQVQAGGETELLIDVLNMESKRLGRTIPDWARDATGSDWQRLGQEYLRRIDKLRRGRPRFTDKSVSNWAHVGAALAMLPGARIVNARRDPLETCFACYRQLFAGTNDYTYDLDDLVDYFAGYDRLSSIWREKFPRRYFEVQYERLQTDTEEQIRRLLDFCELPFDPACLAFHETRDTILTLSTSQVREPMRKRTARGALYGAKLDPLRARLRAAKLSVGEA